jgi:hypothetical protein
MPTTAVGLFENPELVNDAIREIEALGFPRQEVRSVKEPASFDATGIMSFPRLDFEVDLSRELTRIGATEPESRAYVEGLRRGGALAFATGSDEQVKAAGNVMNRHGAIEVEDVSGSEPQLPHVSHENMTPVREGSVMAGRIRQLGGGAAFFVW